MHFRPRCVVELYSFICVWKRRYADVRAGTQAPPLRILPGWITRGTVDAVWVECAMHFRPPMCVVWWGRGLFLQQYRPYRLSLVKHSNMGVGVISSVARRALHICK